jgi:peptidoglycan/xylan/chitin deacetylase (PgdA/CDA1 family)
MLDALLFTKTSPLVKQLYPECLWDVDTKEKVIYLTFDDGPIPEVTPFVLKLLKQYNAKATFFCIGKNIEANRDIFDQIIAEGHTVGNHTYNHLNGWQQENETYFENIEQCNALYPFTLFRPPYGKLKPAQYKYLKDKYKIVMWDVLSFDFDLTVTKEKVMTNVINFSGRGSIIVFHDSIKAREKLEFVLPIIMENFSKYGYRFESLSNFAQ